jgi:hypothetical protein
MVCKAVKCNINLHYKNKSQTFHNEAYLSLLLKNGRILQWYPPSHLRPIHSFGDVLAHPDSSLHIVGFQGMVQWWPWWLLVQSGLYHKVNSI